MENSVREEAIINNSWYFFLLVVLLLFVYFETLSLDLNEIEVQEPLLGPVSLMIDTRLLTCIISNLGLFTSLGHLSTPCSQGLCCIDA